MPRLLKVAAAQIGCEPANATRAQIIRRMIRLLETASSKNVNIVVFPETAFSHTFFPRHLYTDDAELDSFFEHEEDISLGGDTKELFSRAAELRIDISVGYAERTKEGRGYNTAVYYSSSEQKIINKYRKIHLPGVKNPSENTTTTNQYEKRYFTPGDLGFRAFRAPGLVKHALKKDTFEQKTEGKGDAVIGTLICNDRRWPESWRCLGLQGVELVVCGYNTSRRAADFYQSLTSEQAGEEVIFHHKLVMQANGYMNSCFSVSAARAGMDEGKYELISGSCITDPQGHVVAEAKTKGDELIVAQIDLDDCKKGKSRTFDFSRHRRIKSYSLITSQTGVVEPELLKQ